METPVYLFTGFLESGKTKFIQETLKDKRFYQKGTTLVLLCEEGEVELDKSKFNCGNVIVEVIDDKDDLTPDRIYEIEKKYKISRVLIEFNGMWEINHLLNNIPSDWIIYQQMTFFDSRTILNYNANMRSLVVDKIQGTQLVVFNRFDKSEDLMPYHKLVRALNRQCDIVYEAEDGSVKYDDIVDELPFDFNAETIILEDKDYAIWFADIMDDMKKYVGKKLQFTGIVAKDGKMPANSFIIGRHVMVCCAEDIAFRGFICEANCELDIKSKDWKKVVVEIAYEKNMMYKGKGPVLKLISIENGIKPEQEVATFY